MADRKLKLDLEALDVESFASTSASREKGTVMGYVTEQSFYGTCGETCQHTVCDYTCSPHCTGYPSTDETHSGGCSA